MMSDGFITTAEFMWDDETATQKGYKVGESLHTSLHVKDDGNGDPADDDMWIIAIDIQVEESGSLLLNRRNALQLVEALNEIIGRYPEPVEESDQ